MENSALITPFHVLFMVGIIILCLVAAMPTRGWMLVSDKTKRFLRRGIKRKLEAALAAQQQAFHPDESYLPQGVGLALDHARGLVFLAQPEGEMFRCAIQPQTQLGSYRLVVEQENGFHRCFIEILQAGEAQPAWRLPCRDSEVANEIDRTLYKALG